MRFRDDAEYQEGKKMKIVGIDPGSKATAFCMIDSNLEVELSDKLVNREFIALLRDLHGYSVVVEGIQSYGMAVGREVFDTCYQIGRILQVSEDFLFHTPAVYNRPEYSKAICGVGKVTDTVLRAALMTRFGGDKKGEPLHKLKGSSDKRSAFAVAVYHADILAHGRVHKG